MQPQPQRNTSICLGCGYVLDGLSSDRCPECGRSFDSADPRTFQRVLPDPVRIARLPAIDAEAAVIALEEHGIPAVVHREAGGVIVHAPDPEGSLWVDRSDEQRARAFLQSWSGRELPPPATAEPWTCPGCGEIVEPTFDLCWNCGGERPDEVD